jgi:hypothetical protein
MVPCYGGFHLILQFENHTKLANYSCKICIIKINIDYSWFYTELIILWIGELILFFTEMVPGMRRHLAGVPMLQVSSHERDISMIKDKVVHIKCYFISLSVFSCLCSEIHNSTFQLQNRSSSMSQVNFHTFWRKQMDFTHRKFSILWGI